MMTYLQKAEFRDHLIELLKDDQEVYTLIIRRCLDILDVLGYTPQRKAKE